MSLVLLVVLWNKVVCATIEECENKYEGCSYYEEYNSICYFGNTTLVDFENAKISCEQFHNSSLVSIHSELENSVTSSLLFEEMGVSEDEGGWIGLFIIDDNYNNEWNSWNWTDSSIFDYSNWTRDDANSTFEKHCVILTSLGWKVEFCNATYPFICKKIFEDEEDIEDGDEGNPGVFDPIIDDEGSGIDTNILILIIVSCSLTLLFICILLFVFPCCLVCIFIIFVIIFVLIIGGFVLRRYKLQTKNEDDNDEEMKNNHVFKKRKMKGDDGDDVMEGVELEVFSADKSNEIIPLDFDELNQNKNDSSSSNSSSSDDGVVVYKVSTNSSSSSEEEEEVEKVEDNKQVRNTGNLYDQPSLEGITF